MRPAERRLHRLRLEMMDWCRAVGRPDSGPLTAHRATINGDPEVWADV